MYEPRSPKTKPIPREPRKRITNFKRIAKGSFAADIYCCSSIWAFNWDTVWKRIRATASLTIPSPKMIEKSFGYSSYFTMEIAAMTSEEQRREAMTKLSMRSSSIGISLLFNKLKDLTYKLLLFFISPRFEMRLERPAKTKKVMIVPKIPNKRMYPMFSKNRRLLILKPAAKMIGGRHT